MTIFEKAMKSLKITKFCGEYRTKDGTFLIADGEFDVGVTLSVQTSEGIKQLPSGTYTLEDGRIILVDKGKIKEIVEPLVNEPGPNPLETPPWVADGAIGLVGPVGGGGQMKKDVFQDAPATIDNTQKGVDTSAQPVDSGTTTEDAGTKTLTIEEVSKIVTELQTTIASLSDRVAKLEGTAQSSTESNQKMAAEVLKMSDFFSKNTPVTKPIVKLESDDEPDQRTANPKILQVLSAQKKNKK